MIGTKLNGSPRQFATAYPDETVVELLHREGLTGAKLVCGSGVCGACTVLLDGQPVPSCLLPVHHLAGRELQTIEYHHADNLHPVQRAFMAHDGLQCGFCTPGFINSAIAYYERWRASNSATTPRREEIAAALAGNLCRCGAYEGIYAAVAAACAGQFDGDEPVTSPRYEALAKVTGAAKFTVDHHYDDQLEGAILRAIHPHATVRSVDPAPALALPGVFAYVDLLGPERTIRYAGQPIGAIAAGDLRTALDALAQIHVAYDVHAAAVGVEAAQAEDAPRIFADPGEDVPTAAEGFTFRGDWHGNVHHGPPVRTARDAGEAQRRLAAAAERPAPSLVQQRYENAVQAHTTLEPHACLARWDDPRHLTVYLSTQGVFGSAHAIAERFDLAMEDVNLTAVHVGGGFGGKHGLSPEAVAAISLARASGRPVRVALARLEEISYAALRPGAAVEITLLPEEHGLHALAATAYSDNGAAIGGWVAMMLGIFAPDVPRDLQEVDIVTNTPPGRPFRGPSAPQTFWALEQAIDAAAHQLAVDPVTLRKNWYPDDALRHRLLDWAAALPVWSQRARGRSLGRFRRGVGLAASAWPFIYSSDAQVVVGVAGAAFYVRTAVQDIGTGTRTLLARAVADVFGIPRDQVVVDLGRSAAPEGPGSGGSTVSNSVFGPATDAARRLRDQLVAATTANFELKEATAVAGGIRHATGFLSWQDLLPALDPHAVHETRGPEPNAVPFWELLNPHAPAPGNRRDRSLAVTVTQVEVDTRLGKIKPLGVWKAIAAGRIFLPTLARGQVEGGIIQGLGYALYENRQLDLASGFNLASTLEDYHIPGIGDVPPLHVTFFEEGFEQVRGRGIGIAELATVGVAASVGNAVFDATGWRPLKTPITPQAVVAGVHP